MSLSTEATDRLFKRLSATYGAAWDRSMGTAPLADVKTVWAHELAGFSGDKMRSIAWALEHLPERCPNAVEFRNLCRRAPQPASEQLPAPPVQAACPAKATHLLAQVRQIGSTLARDPLAWAKRIRANLAAGKPVSHYARKSAEQVLRPRGLWSI